MPGVCVSDDGFLVAAEISSLMPWDFDVLKSLISLALDTVKSARGDRARFLPVLDNVIWQLTHLWFTDSCGLRPFVQFDVPSQTYALVVSFTDRMDQALVELHGLCAELARFFSWAMYTGYDLAANFADNTFDYIEARLMDASVLFAKA